MEASLTLGQALLAVLGVEMFCHSHLLRVYHVSGAW